MARLKFAITVACLLLATVAAFAQSPDDASAMTSRASADRATEVALDFLAYFGLVERAAPSPAPQRRFELLQTCMVTHDDFRFARPAIGFETFAKGELIASQGADEIRAPCDDCTILMPTREPIIGREAVYLSRAVG